VVDEDDVDVGLWAFPREILFEDAQQRSLSLTKASAGRVERQQRHSAGFWKRTSGLIFPFWRLRANFWLCRAPFQKEEGRKEEEREEAVDEGGRGGGRVNAVFCIW